MCRTLALSVSALALGCSFTAVRPDPKAPAEAEPVCTRSATGRMAADLAGGLTFGGSIFAVTYFGACAGEYSDDCDPFVSAVLGVVLSAPFWLAIYHGHKAGSLCRAAWQRHEAAVSPATPAQASEPEPVVDAKDEPPPDECAARLAAWRRERDRWRRWTLYDRMPSACQRLADQE